MDVIKAVETYITKMVSEPSAMKVLLLDTHTVCIEFLRTYRALIRDHTRHPLSRLRPHSPHYFHIKST